MALAYRSKQWLAAAACKHGVAMAAGCRVWRMCGIWRQTGENNRDRRIIRRQW